MARARCSALFTAGTLVPRVAAASAAGIRSTSHRISVARCLAGRCCSAVMNASLIVSRATAISAGSPCSGTTWSSAIGEIQMSSG